MRIPILIRRHNLVETVTCFTRHCSRNQQVTTMASRCNCIPEQISRSRILYQSLNTYLSFEKYHELYYENRMSDVIFLKCDCSKWNVIRQFNWRYNLSPLCSAIICVPHPCSFVAIILIHWRKVTGWRQSSVRMIQLQCKYFAPSISLTKITK